MTANHAEIANGLSMAMYQVKGLADLIDASEEMGRNGFPAHVQAAVEAIQLIATKAIEDHASRL